MYMVGTVAMLMYILILIPMLVYCWYTAGYISIYTFILDLSSYLRMILNSSFCCSFSNGLRLGLVSPIDKWVQKVYIDIHGKERRQDDGEEADGSQGEA